LLTQHFGENENKNHADEETGLLCSATDTSITDDTNGKSCSETSETDGETSTELNETSEERGLLLEVVGNQDRYDQAVNGNDTSHNDGNDVCVQLSASSNAVRALSVIGFAATYPHSKLNLHTYS
jgi:hypothetical protein